MLYVMLVMFMIMEKHVYVKFLCETWEKRYEYEMVKTTFQEEAVSYMQVLLVSAALELGTHPQICGRKWWLVWMSLLSRNDEVAAEFHVLLRQIED
jgi:hypothetical protein